MLSTNPASTSCRLLGNHATPPDHALVPPTRSARSNSPTRAPSAAARRAAVNPAAPVPSTTTSYSSTTSAPFNVARRQPLAVSPDRRPFLGKGPRALPCVLRCADGIRDRALPFERFRGRPVSAGLDDLLRRLDRQRTVDHDPASDSEGRIERVTVVNDSIDQPELRRPVSRHRFAGQRDLHRDVVRHPFREPEEATCAGDPSALYLGQPELGRPRGDHEIA